MLFSACSPTRPEVLIPKRVIEAPENPVPGTITRSWEEPMYQSARRPAGLDPEGIYFIPSHSELVEIVPGRVQEVQYPPTPDELQEQLSVDDDTIGEEVR